MEIHDRLKALDYIVFYSNHRPCNYDNHTRTLFTFSTYKINNTVIFLYLAPVNRYLTYYISSFSGLSREVWFLSLITLINRAGTMVIPFLTIYLTSQQGFSLAKVGWIMSAFGLGSLCGTWLGGKLTDVYGNYPVMILSSLGAGVGFMMFQYVEGFYFICAALFAIMVVADLIRPAMFVALSAYSKPENKTRSVTLIRLAINLGFAAGPAVGGYIIYHFNYSGLFWIDGITCIIAGILILLLLNPRRSQIKDEIVNESPQSVYQDRQFLWFFLAMVLYAFVFLQLFSTMPVFFKEDLLYTELTIGLLMGLNGALIFIFEMPMIKFLEDTRLSNYRIITIGVVLTAITFLFFNLSTSLGVVILGVIAITFGEMIAIPFSNSWALKRARRGNQGEYMALYSMSFSVSHIIAHNFGMQAAGGIGFTNTWWLVLGIGGLCTILMIFLDKRSR